MTNHPNQSIEYLITRPVPAALIPYIEDRLPRFARSVTCLHGDTDSDPVRYRVHWHEIEILRRAIRSALLAYKTRDI
jgi:hypothetical protein